MSFRLLRYHHFDIMRTLCFVTLAVLIVTVTSRAPRDPNMRERDEGGTACIFSPVYWGSEFIIM